MECVATRILLQLFPFCQGDFSPNSAFCEKAASCRRAADASSPRGLCRTIFILREFFRFCQGAIFHLSPSLSIIHPPLRVKLDRRGRVCKRPERFGARAIQRVRISETRFCKSTHTPSTLFMTSALAYRTTSTPSAFSLRVLAASYRPRTSWVTPSISIASNSSAQ